MSDIEKLKQEVREAQNVLRDAEKRLHEAMCERAGVKVGDVVMMTGGKHDGKRAEITRVQTFDNWTYVYGRLQKKDGGFSVRPIWLGTFGRDCKRIDE